MSSSVKLPGLEVAYAFASEIPFLEIRSFKVLAPDILPVRSVIKLLSIIPNFGSELCL